jgi:Fe-S-cluster containining protein
MNLDGRQPLSVIRLAAGSDAGERVTGRIQLRIDGESVTFEVTVPVEPTPLGDLLPVFQGLTNAVVDRAVAKVEASGQTISCRAGCGACCRQLVPVTESEARILARLVDALPEPRRTTVRDRFADAVRRLGEAGLLDRLTRAFEAGGETIRDVGLAYFAVGVACPFLEAESCSIHPDRPLACREYLVTSPAVNCSTPSPESIEMVPLAGRPSAAVMRVDQAATADGWVPLALAPDWATAHPPPPHEPPAATATLRAVVERLTGGA